MCSHLASTGCIVLVCLSCLSSCGKASETANSAAAVYTDEQMEVIRGAWSKIELDLAEALDMCENSQQVIDEICSPTSIEKDELIALFVSIRKVTVFWAGVNLAFGERIGYYPKELDEDGQEAIDQDGAKLVPRETARALVKIDVKYEALRLQRLEEFEAFMRREIVDHSPEMSSAESRRMAEAILQSVREHVQEWGTAIEAVQEQPGFWHWKKV